MPEGDSVHRVARRMAVALTGRTIVASDFRVPGHATASLAGHRVTGFVARGKHMLLRTDAGWTVHTHVRMQGSWTVLAAGNRLPGSRADAARLLLHLDDGRTAVALDMPVLDLLRTADEAQVVCHLGPDLLTPAGPLGRGAAVPARRLAVDAGGRGRARAAGAAGAPMLCWGLANPGMVTTGDTRPGRTHWVYGRYGRPCLRCGTGVLFRPATGAGPGADRETWWCPSCQPSPAGATSSPRALSSRTG